MTVQTNPREFIRFHKLLMENAPIGYEPFYFLTKKNGKEPVPGISWKKNRKTVEQAYKYLSMGYNIGIAGTDADLLCIVDVDDLDQVPIYQIKPTLGATSRKRCGKHYYYFSADKSAKKNIPTTDAGELRSEWQYVLAPGSYVPCSEEEIKRMPLDQRRLAGMYTVAESRGVSDLKFDELPAVYRARYYEMLHTQHEAEQRDKKRAKLGKVRRPSKYQSSLWDLDITDVSGVSPTGCRRVPMPPEVHGSETGHNCSVRDGLLHCWRHNVVHSPFSYLAVVSGVMKCEQAGKPHGGGRFGVDYQDGKTVYECWNYAKDHGIIPEDDPIPHQALLYYATSRRICPKTDILNGMLPGSLYHIAILVSKREGINLGRQ